MHTVKAFHVNINVKKSALHLHNTKVMAFHLNLIKGFDCVH